MKKRFITVSKALACAGAFAALCSCNGGNSATPISNGSASIDGIAYVYIDSLVNGYDLYNDEMNKFYVKQRQYEQELNGKQSSLERRATELQQNYEKRLITPTRAQEVQQQLSMEGQKLQQTYQQQAMELQDDQAQILGRVSDSIKSCINDYNAVKGYRMIISSTGNSTIVYGDPKLDITADVLKLLNDRYRGNASAAAPAPAAQQQADSSAAK